MNIHYFVQLILIGLLFSACKKDISNHEVLPIVGGVNILAIVEDKSSSSTNRILVDASKDGGVWWFPQGASGYNIEAYHQGQKLADYLRSQGFAVDELSIGAKVTTEVLSRYNKIIRACAITGYTNDEIAAYDGFLNRGSSLLLFQDHLKNFPNDLLSKHLGIEFAGAGGTSVTVLSQHAITTGVTSIPYMVGSAIVNQDKSKMTILGTLGPDDYVDMNKNNMKDAGDVIAAPVMGILHHPKSKIFFMGDVNSVEQVPQPFTSNLVKWLFQ
jgi:hypothetical protein